MYQIKDINTANNKCHLTKIILIKYTIIYKEELKIETRTFTLQGLDAERDVLRESQRLASERDRELETLRQQVRYFMICFLMPSVDSVTCI